MTISQANLYRAEPFSLLERLPLAQLGIVLGQLVRGTGTEGIVNDADVPIILRNIHSLACTSKTLYHAVNDPLVVEILLNFLAVKQKQPAAHFAAELNTIGTRRWVWSYILQNNYDETYAIIQDIYEIAARIKKEARNAGLIFNVADGRETEPEPDPCTYQTQTGFLLCHGPILGIL